MSDLQLSPRALLFSFAAACVFAALDLTQKWSSRYAVSTPAGFLGLRLLAGALLSPLLLLLPGGITTKEAPILPVIGLILTNLIGNVLYVISVYRADISVVGSLWPLKSAYLPILVLLLPAHVLFPPVGYLLMLTAILGAFLVAWNGRLQLRALRERPVAIMVWITVPIFALSDYFFQQVAGAIGSKEATVLVSEALAVCVVPLVLLHRPSRAVLIRGVKKRNGVIGALLTGLFLVAGVYLIGEAFQSSGPAGLVLVNIYAMLSGVILLLVNAARPGWLEKQPRGVYGTRLAGAALLIAAAGGLERMHSALAH